MTALALILAVAAVVAAGAAVFLLAANGQLRRLLAVREAELRQVRLEAGHAIDAATIPTLPLAENAGVLVKAGLLKPGILGGSKLPVAVALVLALLSATPARASDLLPAGTAISTTAGDIVILDDEYLLVDRGEVAGIAIMVRDLGRCQAALAECDAVPKPNPATTPAPRSRAGWWAAALAASFAAGLAAGVTASN